MNRLAIIKTDHHPNIPYKIKDVHKAARFILQGAAIQAPALATTSPSSSQTTGGNEYLKTETFASMMAEFTKTMNEALSYTHPCGSSNRTQLDIFECNYCGEPHLIRNCPHVEEDIKAGKCKKNHEGKVVLPNGYFVSRAVPGKSMRDRIYEWLHRNPNPTATLMHTIKEPLLLCPPPSITTAPSVMPAYQLSADDRI